VDWRRMVYTLDISDDAESALADLALIQAGEVEGIRRGSVVEHRRGNYFLTVIEWEDGHREVEVHHCDPRPIARSCDPKDVERFKCEFERLAKGESHKETA